MPASAACSSACSGVRRHARISPRTSSRLRLHVLARDQRLEVEAQQRLGVGGPDVEVPVGVVDRDPVEAGQLAVGVALGDLLHLRRRVGDLGVDLAGDEVARAELGHQLGQRAAVDREQLEHQQRRDRPRVGVPEVAEVVVAGDLAAEGRALLAHPRLEEGVADAGEVGAAALGGDQVGHGAAGARVVEDRRAGVLGQRRAGEQGADEVAVAELAVAVDEEAAVGVAVPGDAEVGAAGAHPLDDHPPVLLAAAGWARGRGTRRRARSTSPPGRGRACRRIGPTIGPAIPLPPSTTTFIGLTFGRVDEGERVGAVLVPDVDLLEGAAAGRVAEAGFDLAPHVADPGVAGERQRALADQLDAGVGLRVVRGGDHRAAVELARADQVVEHLGRDHARRRARSRPRRSARRAAPPPSPARSAACRGRARPAARPAACRAAAPARGRRRGRSRARSSRPSPRRRGRGCRRP